MGEAKQKIIEAARSHKSQIKVLVTGADKNECFTLRINDQSFGLHATELIDLMHKANEAFLEWSAAAGIQWLKVQGRW